MTVNIIQRLSNKINPTSLVTKVTETFIIIRLTKSLRKNRNNIRHKLYLKFY